MHVQVLLMVHGLQREHITPHVGRSRDAFMDEGSTPAARSHEGREEGSSVSEVDKNSPAHVPPLLTGVSQSPVRPRGGSAAHRSAPCRRTLVMTGS